MKKALFICETVAFAHMDRLHEIALKLNHKYEIFFAYADNFDPISRCKSIHYIPLSSVSTNKFNRGLRTGKAFMSEKTLSHNVKVDLGLVQQFRPDFVFGDFRLSLFFSRQLMDAPYVNICNAYWYNHYQELSSDPEGSVVRPFRDGWGLQIYRRIQRRRLARHLEIYQRVARQFGVLPPQSVHDMYTRSDHTWFCDLPSLFNEVLVSKSNYRFIGPIELVNGFTLPSWWSAVQHASNNIFVNLGSGRPTEELFQLLPYLGSLPFQFIVATSNMEFSKSIKIPSNVFLCDQVSGGRACEVSQLVITNGGSGPSYQALICGKPLIVIPDNPNQRAFSEILEKKGVALSLRIEGLDLNGIASSLGLVLRNPIYSWKAQGLQKEWNKMSSLSIMIHSLEKSEFFGDGEPLNRVDKAKTI